MLNIAPGPRLTVEGGKDLRRVYLNMDKTAVFGAFCTFCTCL